MKIKKHFRTSQITTDYILTDFSFNRITNRDVYFNYCVNKRLELLNNKYNSKLDSMLSFIIKHCSPEDLPVEGLSRIILSLTKVTNTLSKGFVSLLR